MAISYAMPEAVTRVGGSQLGTATQRRLKPHVVENHRWGVILAGGDGTRLLSLTRRLSGDERPKQFCRLFGGKTLLAHTQERIAPNITRDHILYALARTHQPLYASELRSVPPIRMIEQPHNRGTLPAIVYSLIRLKLLDEHAVVAFVPSDHYYENEEGFRSGLDLAFQEAETNRDAIILLGVKARSPEVEYGWIEPTNVVAMQRASHRLFDVQRFWEKPSIEDALALLGRGCLWNTFTMVGSVSAFLKMIERTAPDLCLAFNRILDGATSPTAVPEEICAMYESLPSYDFSREILSKNSDRLSVLSLGDVGWSDLGDPVRVLTALASKGLESTRQRLNQDEIRSARVRQLLPVVG